MATLHIPNFQVICKSYSMLFGMFLIACRTPKSPRTSSAPPKIASNLYLDIGLLQEDLLGIVMIDLRSVEHLNRPSHPSLRESSPTKDLN